MLFCILGAGYVGKALLSSKKDSNISFYATTTSEEKLEEIRPLAEKVFLFHIDDTEKLKEILEDCDGIGVFIAPKKNQTYEDTYLKTAHSIASALKGRIRPFYLLYTSSTSVYKKEPQDNVLLDTENIYLTCAKGPVKVAILRLGGIYGPGRDLSKRAFALSGKTLPGTGEELTNHIHVNDIVSAVSFCITHQLEGIFDLVNDEHPTRKELYESLSKELNIEPPSWAEKSTDLKRKISISNHKIRKAGFNFSHAKF